MSTKKKLPSTNARAKLEGPLHRNNPEELVTRTRQVTSIQQSTNYSTQPGVQAASTTLLASTDAYEKTLFEIAKKKAELDALTPVRDTQRGAVLRDRAYLESSVTTAARGVADAVKALNCAVSTRTTTVQTSNEAPAHLVLKNSLTTPGMITARCKAVRGGASYVFAFTTDPNTPPGAGTSIASTKAKCEIAGQALGHVIYVRVAVVRKVGGQSAWSEPTQILVR